MNTCFQLTKLTVACAACLGLLISSAKADDTTEYVVPADLAELLSWERGQIWIVDADGNRTAFAGDWSYRNGQVDINWVRAGWDTCERINVSEEVPFYCLSHDRAWFVIRRIDNFVGMAVGEPGVIGFRRTSQSSSCQEEFELDAVLDSLNLRFVANGAPGVVEEWW